MNHVRKLALGTVQWGKPYGIANTTGRPDDPEVATILGYARDAAIDLLDTAQVYGTAEDVIGRLDPQGEFRVVTKTAVIDSDRIDRAACEHLAAEVSHSLTRLGRRSVDGLLVHQSTHLLLPGSDRLWDLLARLKEQGVAKAVGVSVYHPDELRAIVDRYPVDLVQLPFNVYDQRFASTGLLAELKSAGIEVHARSAFLQGLLLMPPQRLAPQFGDIKAHHRRWHAAVAAAGVSPARVALTFALSRPGIDRVIVGCETAAQFADLLEHAEDGGDFAELAASFDLSHHWVVDPSHWNSAVRTC